MSCSAEQKLFSRAYFPKVTPQLSQIQDVKLWQIN